MDDLDRTPLADAYRAAYTEQIRARLLVDNVSNIDTDGPLHRKTPLTGRGFLTYTGLDGLEGAELDALIARQCAHFGAHGLSVEWKTHGLDRPADLTDRLAAAGFVPEERETLIVGEAAVLAGEAKPPEGVRIREVSERADLEKIAAMQETVWGYDCSWMVDALTRDLSEVGDPAVVIVAEVEATGEVVCAAWMRFHEGTEFTSFWGGSTLEQWRGKGIYKAMVAYRARLAVERGYKYVQVDASDDSMPILRRLGLLAVETTTPYVWGA
ncbi:GNAT family N-acetyltransferase [Phytomonospora sp. NPDC050363]|uniref:GNAT family N-acetyltransferase n=1 Tax=Phytomonospora sp. NPDC050363 TaxID=3155642 RepID=UPI0033E5E1D8